MVKEILLKKYDKYINGLDIYENDNSLTLSRLVIKDEFRNSGIGTRIMGDLIKYADQYNKILALTPSSDFGGVKSKLISFYKRFGFKLNKGNNKNYEFRDTMIREPKLNEMKNDKLKGGLSDKLSLEDIAKKFKVSLDSLRKELGMGIKIEMEHVNDKELAKEIAMDHLVELPNYYTELNKMEKKAENDLVKEMVSEGLSKYINKKVKTTIK